MILQVRRGLVPIGNIASDLGLTKNAVQKFVKSHEKSPEDIQTMFEQLCEKEELEDKVAAVLKKELLDKYKNPSVRELNSTLIFNGFKIKRWKVIEILKNRLNYSRRRLSSQQAYINSDSNVILRQNFSLKLLDVQVVDRKIVIDFDESLI